jgi:2-polyprenyl-6-methoxyphenol hydroxylase-like FAD-dependent oxidoreductase
MPTDTIETTCCIVGGGPAGIMLGYLLARRGVAVTVLEKHNDFFRDFRGDTVHPSTLDILDELGLLGAFLKLPHQQIASVEGSFGGYPFRAADFSRVPARCKFVALMPQWDFLNFLSSRARSFPSFDLRMRHQAVDLLRYSGRVAGVLARTPDGDAQILADVVIGCDGRHSVTRAAAALEVIESGVPIDVVWFRVSRKPTDPDQLFGNINYGKALIQIDRDSYFQSALIIRKGSFEELKSKGLDSLRKSLVQIAPHLIDRVDEIENWDQIQLLSVQINRLRHWHGPGLLCIGDAAHAMSPAGGVGINLAIQDAVATANLLARPLLDRRLTQVHLAAVQHRREWPTRVTQFFQVNAHKGFEYVFRHPGPLRAPWQLKAVTHIPGLPHLTARFIGMGVRPEHVRGCKARPSLLKRVAIASGIAAAVAGNVLRGR